MSLKQAFRQKWMNTLPLEIKIRINRMTQEQFYFDLSVTQEMLSNLVEERTEGVSAIQWAGKPEHNVYCPAILLAKINSATFRSKPFLSDLFHHGMLSVVHFPDNEEIPSFFGKKLQGILRRFARRREFYMHIISELPQWTPDRGQKPATHHIMLSTIEPRLAYYKMNNYDLTLFGEPIWFSHYSPSFDGPNNEWELLDTTMTAHIWVNQGMAAYCRGRKQQASTSTPMLIDDASG